MPALAAVAGALTLAFACTSARAGAATRQASAFDLTVSSPLAVIATIERREPGAGRIDTFRAQVTDTIAGTVPDALRVVSERAFPSDPPALAEGRGYLLFLGEVPTQSLWRAFRSDARARHLADSGKPLDGLRDNVRLLEARPVHSSEAWLSLARIGCREHPSNCDSDPERAHAEAAERDQERRGHAPPALERDLRVRSPKPRRDRRGVTSLAKRPRHRSVLHLALAHP